MPEAPQAAGAELSVGLAPLESKRFGVSSARADGVTSGSVPRLLSFATEHEVDLVIARCDGADQAAARALITAGFVPLEAQLTYEGAVVPADVSVSIREGESADREAVAEIAREAFGDAATHYHADPRLAPEQCRDVYVDWSLRGLAREAAQVFYIVELEKQPVAYGMFDRSGERMRIVLAAVARRARGRGLYLHLLQHGMSWGAGFGAAKLVAITGHGNIAAQRTFVNAGLAPTASTWTFHGWREDFATSPESVAGS